MSQERLTVMMCGNANGCYKASRWFENVNIPLIYTMGSKNERYRPRPVGAEYFQRGGSRLRSYWGLRQSMG